LRLQLSAKRTHTVQQEKGIQNIVDNMVY